MKGAGAVLPLGAPRAARWLALRFLDEAQDARARLDDPADAEGLHDFRVALRRLRSTLRAYPDALQGSIRRKDRRRLRALAQATGATRDGEVMIGWMEARREALSEAATPGLDALVERLRGRQESLAGALRKEVSADFAREHRRLRQRLAAYTASVDAVDPRESPAMRHVLAERVSAEADALRQRLAEIVSVAQQEAAHEGRIAAKRLRYLLEPFADDLAEAREIVKRLKRLQDVLGEMHDAHVAEGVVAAARESASDEERAGLEELATEARREMERRFAEAEGEWFGGRPAAFFAVVDALVARLRSGGGDREIERKFLLRRMPSLPGDAVRTEIVQGWIPGEHLHERIRRVRSGGETHYYRTIKLGSGLNRMELEEETTEAIFRRLWPLTKGKRIRKRRYRVAEGELTWEIDRFRGRRLVLAEVELPSEDAESPLPAWLAPYVERDVTGESAYVNLNLAG